MKNTTKTAEYKLVGEAELSADTDLRGEVRVPNIKGLANLIIGAGSYESWRIRIEKKADTPSDTIKYSAKVYGR